MAEGTTSTFGEFIIELGDGGNPETFAFPCGLLSKGFERTANMNSTVVPDCEDEDLAGYEQVDIASKKAALSGSGVMTTESFDVWDEWWESDALKNVRVRLPKVLKQWTGAAHLATFSLTAERGNKVQVEVSIEFDGKPTRSATA